VHLKSRPSVRRPVSRITSVEDHKLAAQYQSVREILRSPKYADRGSKPLAFWALPQDRRLPMALLGYSLKDLLAHSFEKLSATAGIGKKKLSSLIKLLHRATKDQPPAVTQSIDGPAARPKRSRRAKQDPSAFNPAIVSELVWEQWRQTVRRCGLEQESLGRLSPSLYRLPTVIWRTPLARYLNLTVHQMRRLKTHGEKRVQAILEVFHGVQELLGHAQQHSYLHAELRPKFTVPLERWIIGVLSGSRPPRPAELKQRLIKPLLEQVRIDAGPEVFRIAQERLGLKSASHSVQKQARRLRVTRARVYQLLEMCGDVLSVRWPEGEVLFRRLHEKLSSYPSAKAQAAQLRRLTAIVYPSLAPANHTVG
jgi:hypothetical protein